MNPKKSSFSIFKNLCYCILQWWVLKLHRSQITHLNCIFLRWNDCSLSHWCLNKSHFLFPPSLFRSRSNRPLIIYIFFFCPTRIVSGLLGNLNPTQSGAEPLCVYGGVRHGPLNPTGEDESGSPRCFSAVLNRSRSPNSQNMKWSSDSFLTKRRTHARARAQTHKHTQYSLLTTWCRGRQTAPRVDLSTPAAENSPFYYFFERQLKM